MDPLEQTRKKILIAEDEQDMREALFTILAAQGHEVIAAANGEEALEMALAEHPDLILLDIRMPKKNGQEVLEAVKADEWGKDAMVVMLTAFNDMDTVSTMLDLGASDYLVKSDWELQDIVKKVNEKLAVQDIK